MSENMFSSIIIFFHLKLANHKMLKFIIKIKKERNNPTLKYVLKKWNPLIPYFIYEAINIISIK